MIHAPRIRGRLLAVVAALTLATAAACGSGSGSGSISTSAATYAPAAYGQEAGHNYDCYYVDTPAEVTDLVNAGLCPFGSIPTPMPTAWEQEYWSYYSSPSYYDDYMPPSARSTYVHVTVVKFGSTYKTQIAKAQSTAVYKSSTGHKVTGSSHLKFATSSSGSSGSGSLKKTTTHGGGAGSVSVGSCAMSMTVLQDKGSSTTSHGNGAGSSSHVSSGSHSVKSGSSAKGDC